MSPVQYHTPSILELAGARYLAGEAAGSIPPSSPLAQNNDSLVPVTIIDITGLDSINSTIIRTVTRTKTFSFLARDDVFDEVFTQHVLFKAASGTGSRWKCHHPDLELPHFQTELPREGPYFLIGTILYKVLKLYPDTYNAFMYGILQSHDSQPRFEKFSTDGYIPVPSRLYYDEGGVQRPLSGKRIAVKDIYDIEGLATGASSQAYLRLSKPAVQTARCIQTLLDLGAIIVGKAKTVQFASGMTAGDWTEMPCPTNPRGDGFLDPDCSSSGSAVSIAGYGWLDYSVGSDSLGSMTGPAAACGIFGVRPSTGLLSNDGALKVSTHLDTPGCFARSISELSTVARKWLYNPNGKFDDRSLELKPSKILMSEEVTQIFVRMQPDVVGGFLTDLERYCGVKSTPLNVADRWKSKRPPGIKLSLEDYLATTVAHIQLHDSYHNNFKFQTEYMATFDEKPSVDPMIQYKWDLGSKISEAEYERACEEKRIFKEFLDKEVFTERTVMILPGGFPSPSYRDRVSRTDEERNQWQGFGLQNTTLPVLGGMPAVVLPGLSIYPLLTDPDIDLNEVGERKYRSKFSGKDENQPVSVMILGPCGSDEWLIGVLEKAWKQSGRPMGVRVGSTLF